MNAVEFSTAPLPRAAARAHAPVWLGAVLVLALWLLARPYLGLRHDGILYLGQTLHHRFPGLLDSDLFFAFGSQDRFSWFAVALARLQNALGLTASQILVLGVSHAAFLGATVMLVRPLLNARELWLGLVALAVMSHYYGGLGLLSFTENFVTARTAAEPLALAALALWCSGRRAWAVAAIVPAFLMHPLMALPVVMVWWCWLVGEDRRWAWLAALGPVALLLAAAGIGPFALLLGRMDPDWRELAEVHNRMVFIHLWETLDAMKLAVDVGVLAVAARTLGPMAARLCVSVLGATALGFTVSLVGADLLHNPLITGLQLWRVQWLAHLLALALLPALLMRAWSSRPIDQVVTLACALLVLGVNGWWETSWAFGLVCAAAVLARRRAVTLSPRATSWTRAALAAALVALSLALLMRTLQELQAQEVEFDPSLMAWALAKVPTVSLGLAAAVLWLARTWPAQALAALALAVVVAWGTAVWDRRPQWVRYIEQSQPGSHPFSAHIPKGANVYWPGNRGPKATELAAVWAALGRPSYFSYDQGGGIVFHRQTAMAFKARQDVLGPVLVQREICQLMESLTRQPGSAPEPCPISTEVLDELCAQPQGPDYIVLPQGVWRDPLASWTFEVPSRRSTYSLHRCRTHA